MQTLAFDDPGFFRHLLLSGAMLVAAVIVLTLLLVHSIFTRSRRAFWVCYGVVAIAAIAFCARMRTDMGWRYGLLILLALAVPPLVRIIKSRQSARSA